MGESARDVLDDAVREKEWSQQVVDYLTLRGWRVYRTWNSQHSPAGFPDIIAVRGKRLVAIELKTKRGRLTRAQAQWLGSLLATGKVETYVFRPLDWDLVEELFA